MLPSCCSAVRVTACGSKLIMPWCVCVITQTVQTVWCTHWPAPLPLTPRFQGSSLPTHASATSHNTWGSHCVYVVMSFGYFIRVNFNLVTQAFSIGHSMQIGECLFVDHPVRARLVSCSAAITFCLATAKKHGHFRIIACSLLKLVGKGTWFRDETQ